MNILITGVCGFVGSTLARAMIDAGLPWTLFGFDNLSRPGSELNRAQLGRLGVKLIHGDLRCQSDVDALPAVDWIIDCAANPSVLAGADGQTSSRQLMEHNLLGTLQLLAASCSDAVRQHADCWLRTPSGSVPSDFISRTALANLLHANISSLAKNPVTQFILRKQTPSQITCEKPLDRKGRAA